jgi:glycosyltransferase involved in cell wall biosynthesis
MNEKKILFVHMYNSFSGSPKVLENVIKVLSRDSNCLLITNHTDGFLDNVNVRKFKFYFRLTNNKITTLFNFIFAQLSIFFLVLRLANKDDMVYVNTTIPVFAALGAKLKGACVVFHLHEDTKSLNVIHRSLSLLRRFCCDHEIFVSNYLHSKEHILGTSYKIIPNCLSEDFVTNVHQNSLPRSSFSPFKVLMVCSLKKYKGVWELIDICNELLTEPNVQIDLVVSEDEVSMGKFFENSQIPNNLTIHPKAVDVAKHYENASLILNLSRPDEWVETFGLTILEGMVYGLPCIVPPVGGPVELVKNNFNGFTISCYQTKQVANLILDLYKDENLYNKMSANSIELSKNFNFYNFKNDLKDFVDSVWLEAKS